MRQSVSAYLLSMLTSLSKLSKGPLPFSSLLATLALLFVVGGRELPKGLWAPEQRGIARDVKLASENTKEETVLLKVRENSGHWERAHGIMAF